MPKLAEDGRQDRPGVDSRRSRWEGGGKGRPKLIVAHSRHPESPEAIPEVA